MMNKVTSVIFMVLLFMSLNFGGAQVSPLLERPGSKEQVEQIRQRLFEVLHAHMMDKCIEVSSGSDTEFIAESFFCNRQWWVKPIYSIHPLSKTLFLSDLTVHAQDPNLKKLKYEESFKRVFADLDKFIDAQIGDRGAYTCEDGGVLNDANPHGYRIKCIAKKGDSDLGKWYFTKNHSKPSLKLFMQHGIFMSFNVRFDKQIK